ncbi:ImmA/IrrE family metallo-endopeptidase [Methylosinus sp. Ce-a6]|uniref:ImmA/IrrE family metallo-endopeptidase n=1 Tax=Methylosinus sp. Ce-a6 TaxID=2172005 RepID=UPI001359C3E0|nr:ImmA/IrrE family metallo-endopeptidase [Methylosinus sp. Ce-a6]
MSDKKFTAVRWALDMTALWEVAAPGDRFPVDVEKIAMEVSASRYPKDPLKAIKGGSLPGFEGALYPLGEPRDGWAIIYNNSGISEGRKRFTLAHEFGHYLAHRHDLPDGIKCDEKVVTRRNGKGIEKEADEFAAYLLMPFDDFKARIPPTEKPTLEDLLACKERYGVSLVAAILRWLDYTERRAVLVVSRDGGALWSRSSGPALNSRRFFRTSAEPFMLPDESMAVRGDYDSDGRAHAVHPAGVWFPEETEEATICYKAHDWCVTLLHLPRELRYTPPLAYHTDDVVDRFTRGSKT